MAEPSQGMLAKLAPFLLGGGAGLLASRGDVAGLGPGLLQGGELAQQQLLNRIRLEQAEQLKREQAEKEAQAARERAIAQGAPAEQRLLAEAFPEAYAASQLKPESLPAGYVRGPNGGMMLDPGYVQGRADIAAAEAKARQPYGPNISGGPFAGTGMTAQATNAYMRLALKKQRGEPLTPQENLEYALAKRQLESSRFVQGEDGVNYVLPAQPLPWDESPSGPREAVPGVTPKLTDEQAKAAGFYERANAASGIVEDMTGKANTSAITAKKIVSTPPLLGPVLGAGVNAMMKPETQNMEQAQRDFVNAVLRRESGAVINPDEFSNAQQQYFPQPGDSAEVIRQKEANRQRVIQSLKQGAGKYTPQPSEDKGEWTDVGNGVRIRKKP